jgi:uncharacterized protein YbjT (DUF2867 family)
MVTVMVTRTHTTTEMAVLVIGAAGTIGRHVVRELVDRDVDVTAFVRELPDEQPTHPRISFALGDLAQPETVHKAAADCTAVFILTPHSPDQVNLQNTAVDAAAGAGAKVVKLSSWGPVVRSDSPVPGARRHWITQQYILKRGIPYTFLQPNHFMQVLLTRYASEIRRTGRLAAPAGDRGISMIDARDVAEVAALTLIEPGHDGRSYVLTGPTAPSYGQIARLVNELTGRDVTYHDLSEEEFAAWTAEQGRLPWEVEHAAAIYQLYRTGVGELITDDVERITGHPPRNIEEFLAEHQNHFIP